MPPRKYSLNSPRNLWRNDSLACLCLISSTASGRPLTPQSIKVTHHVPWKLTGEQCSNETWGCWPKVLPEHATKPLFKCCPWGLGRLQQDGPKCVFQDPIIQKLARHSSLATTQRYIEVSEDKLFNAVNGISVWISANYSAQCSNLS